MKGFSKEEIFTATEVVRNFSSVLTSIQNGSLKRAVVVKNSKFEAVLLSISEYERLADAVVLLEQIYTTSKKADDGN